PRSGRREVPGVLCHRRGLEVADAVSGDDAAPQLVERVRLEVASPARLAPRVLELVEAIGDEGHLGAVPVPGRYPPAIAFDASLDLVQHTLGQRVRLGVLMRCDAE